MASLADGRLSFNAWSRNCAAQMLRQKSLETGTFETAQTHILRVTQGRCQLFADRPRLLGGFGYSEATLGTTRFQLLNWKSDSVEYCTATKRAQDLILYIPLEGRFEARRGARSVQVNPGEIYFVSATGETTRRWLGSSVLLNVIIPNQTMTRLLAADFDIASDEPLSFPESASLSTQETETLCRFLETILCDLGSPHSILSHPGASAHVERAFLHALIHSLPHNYSHRLDIDGYPAACPPYLLRAERFIRDHVADDIDVAELAHVTGVSPRTLYYGFKRYRGTSPQRFLKTTRLRLAREALIGGYEEKISVIAARFGYGNAAQFSKDYRNMFALSPREDLRYIRKAGGI